MFSKRKLDRYKFSYRHKNRKISLETVKELRSLGVDQSSKSDTLVTQVRPISKLNGPQYLPNRLDTGRPCVESALPSERITNKSTGSDRIIYTGRHTVDFEEVKVGLDSDIRYDSADLKKDLEDWALRYNIRQNALSGLLRILKKYPLGTDLPKDARTLVKTPRNLDIKSIGGGQYWHYGLANVLNHMYRDLTQSGHEVTTLDLIVNIDGLPLAKSSSGCFWPILVSEPILKKVYIAGVFYGHEKPSNANEFLENFVSDLNEFLLLGYHLDANLQGHNKSRPVKVKFYALICDAPAKSFLLQVKGHSGYNSCTKCTIHGNYEENRVCFPSPPPLPGEQGTDQTTRIRNRTDDSVANMMDEDFHSGESILKSVPNFGFVSNVPLEYMHLICLGIVKKMLLLWLCGPLKNRLPAFNVKQISKILVSFRDCCPTEFERKPRELQYFKQWKATEFRQFLLYSGPVVLKQFLRDDVYNNFLALHIAITILLKPEFVTNKDCVNFANRLLNHFVNTFGALYGDHNISHNVHGLLHVTSDVEVYGSLDTYSAFRFESFLFQLKKLLRKNERPLSQLAKRYLERESFDATNINVSKDEVNYLKCEHCLGPLSETLTKESVKNQFKVYRGVNIYINCKEEKNSICMLKDGSIFKVKNIVLSDTNGILIVGSKYKVLKENLYTFAEFESKTIGIKVIGDITGLNKCYKFSDIKCKLWKMKYNDKFVVFPLHKN